MNSCCLIITWRWYPHKFISSHSVRYQICFLRPLPNKGNRTVFLMDIFLPFTVKTISVPVLGSWLCKVCAIHTQNKTDLYTTEILGREKGGKYEADVTRTHRDSVKPLEEIQTQKYLEKLPFSYRTGFYCSCSSWAGCRVYKSDDMRHLWVRALKPCPNNRPHTSRDSFQPSYPWHWQRTLLSVSVFVQWHIFSSD